ncbi:MAG: hypothetical protein ACREO5_12425 [Candidatus Binatia bacterium]
MEATKTKQQSVAPSPKGKMKVEKLRKETLQDLNARNSEQIKAGAYTMKNCCH